MAATCYAAPLGVLRRRLPQVVRVVAIGWQQASSSGGRDQGNPSAQELDYGTHFLISFVFGLIRCLRIVKQIPLGSGRAIANNLNPSNLSDQWSWNEAHRRRHGRTGLSDSGWIWN